MLGVLKQRWADTDRRPKTIVADRRRLVGEALDGVGPAEHRRATSPRSTGRPHAASPPTSTPRPRADRSAVLRPGVEKCAAAFESYETLKRRRGIIDFDDVLSHTIRELRPRHRLRRLAPLALPPRARRRGAGPQPAPTPAGRHPPRRARRPVPRRRPVAGDLRLQRRRPDAARRRGAPVSRHRDHPPADEPSVHAADRRCRAARARRQRATGRTRVEPSRRPCGQRDRAAPTRTPRRPASPRSSPPATPRSCAPARSPCWCARTPRSAPIVDALAGGGHRRPPQRVGRRFADAGRDPPGRRARVGVAAAGVGPRHARRAEPRRARLEPTAIAGPPPGRRARARTRPACRPCRARVPPRLAARRRCRVPGLGGHHQPVRRRQRRRRRGADVPRVEGSGVAHRRARRRRDQPRAPQVGHDRRRDAPRRAGCSTSP